MGYACPVCEERQVDAEHLANHVAFTAILRGGNHETWLDDHVPEWDERSPATLGSAIAEFAESFEMAVPDDSSHSRSRDRSKERSRLGIEERAGSSRDTEATGPAEKPGERAKEVSPEDEAVLETARELTRRMLADDPEPADSEKE